MPLDAEKLRSSIDPATALGAVHLVVRDLDRAVAFYETRLGFRVLAREPGMAWLGVDGRELLVLRESRVAARERGTTGLYHFAVRVPFRRDLARSLARLIETGTPLQGAADHRVSEALYLSDPEGNGIEIYRDRPREQWAAKGGKPLMTTEALDLAGLLAERGADDAAWNGLANGTDLGHVHLTVSHLGKAERFYVEGLGFDVTMRAGNSALFVSAGGYHHHLGLNTWAGEGAPAPPEGAAGLHSFEVRLPKRAALERTVARLEAAGFPAARAENGFETRDPFQNVVRLTSAEDAR
jgi:catechol 2,3-dioxygenase